MPSRSWQTKAERRPGSPIVSLAAIETGCSEPEAVNADPYGEGWLIRIRLSEPAEADELLDAGAYRAFLAEQ